MVTNANYVDTAVHQRQIVSILWAHTDVFVGKDMLVTEKPVKKVQLLSFFCHPFLQIVFIFPSISHLLIYLFFTYLHSQIQ